MKECKVRWKAGEMDLHNCYCMCDIWQFENFKERGAARWHSQNNNNLCSLIFDRKTIELYLSDKVSQLCCFMCPNKQTMSVKERVLNKI